MATAVQLSLELDGDGALSILDRFKQKWDAFVGSVNGSVGKLSGASSKFGEMEDAEKRAHEAGQLLTRTFGVEMPRALETVMAKSRLLGPVLAAGFQVSVYAAAIPVLAEMGTKFKELSDDAAGYTERIKQIREETIKASQEAFLNPETLKVAQAHSNELTRQITLLNKAAAIENTRMDTVHAAVGVQEKIVALLFSGTVNAATSADLAARAMEQDDKRRQINEAITKTMEERNALEDAGLAKQKEAGLQGYALAAQQLEDFKNSKGYQVLKIKDAEAANAQLLAHEADYNNTVIGLRRQNADQTISLRHQVTEEGLVGIAKISQSEVDALEDVNRNELQTLISHKDAEAQRALIAQKTSRQIIEYHRQEAQETRSLQNEAVLSGLRDDAKIIASAQFKKEAVGDLLARGLIDESNYNARIRALNTETNNELLQAAKDRLRKTKELQDQAAEDQATAQEDAALAVVPEWQRATAQLEIELNRRLRAIQVEKIKELAAENLTEDQKLAINQIAEAKRYDAIVTTNERIRAENKRNVEQLGSDLESVYDDIGSGNLGKRIVANMKKLFFEILAQWILTSQQMKSIFGGLFGTMLFGPGSMESQMGGAAAGGLGGFGGLFGGGTPGVSPSGGTPPFFPPGFGGGASFSAAGLATGGGIAPGGAGAVDPVTAALMGASGSGNPLTTQSLSSAGVVSSLTNPAQAGRSGSAAQQGLFGGLFSGGVGNGLIGLGGIATSLFGGKLGGTAGTIGGALAGLLVTGQLAGLNSALLGSVGLAGAGAIMGGAVGGLLGFGIGSQNGGLFGSLAGAGSGALTGFLVGGPVGALLGGIIGLLGGIFGGIFGGHKRKKAAEQYFSAQVQPAIKQTVADYEDHQLDYGTATSNLEQLRSQAQDQLKSLKGEGKDEFKKVVSPAIDAAEKQINNDENERNRRAGLVFGPPQFHDGGFVNAAISQWTTKPGELLALLKDGEYVMSPQATARNRGTLEAMNSGKDVSMGGGDTHIHLHAWDTKSLKQWLKSGGAEEIDNAITRRRVEGK